MRNILVATDLTDASAPAVRAALDLGRRLDADVTAVHVVAPPYDQGSIFTSLTAGDREYLDALVQRERAAAEGVLRDQLRAAAGEPTPARAVRALVKVGTPADTVLAAAAETQADLIVVGTHGRTGWQHLVLGSVAEKLIRRAPMPVLTVRSAR